jgi:hypothetical protein
MKIGFDLAADALNQAHRDFGVAVDRPMRLIF